MKLWHGLVIAVVSLILQACLFAAISYLLSRHMGKWPGILFPPSHLQGPSPSLQQDEPQSTPEYLLEDHWPNHPLLGNPHSDPTYFRLGITAQSPSTVQTFYLRLALAMLMRVGSFSLGLTNFLHHHRRTQREEMALSSNGGILRD